MDQTHTIEQAFQEAGLEITRIHTGQTNTVLVDTHRFQFDTHFTNNTWILYDKQTKQVIGKDNLPKLIRQALATAKQTAQKASQTGHCPTSENT